MTLLNSFVVDDVNQKVYVNGALFSDFTFHPPPNVEFPGWAGRWIETVTCDPGTPPRYTVHGMFNGTPVDLTATTPPIEMVD
jgi:hypothetical protein